jgi:DNA-binding GntR family transcriptional regulator
LLLSIAPQDFRRLEPYLPKGLVSQDTANPLDRAAGVLARLVLTQQLHPGQKIPMDEIAERIQASRTPVREALRLLETDGLVVALPNRGFIVRRLDPAETGHLYAARQCIEAFLARKAFLQRSKPFLAELRALHRIYMQVLGGDSDRRRLGMLVDKAFHLRIAEQGGNPHLTAQLANVFDRLILTRPMEGFPVNRMQLAVGEHAAIVAAFEGGSVRAAVDALMCNINNGSAAIVAHMHSMRQFSFDGSRPVEEESE